MINKLIEKLNNIIFKRNWYSLIKSAIISLILAIMFYSSFSLGLAKAYINGLILLFQTYFGAIFFLIKQTQVILTN